MTITTNDPGRADDLHLRLFGHPVPDDLNGFPSKTAYREALKERARQGDQSRQTRAEPGSERHRTCTSKIRHSTIPKAEKAIAQKRERGFRGRLRVYQCPHCFGFHVTRSGRTHPRVPDVKP